MGPRRMGDPYPILRLRLQLLSGSEATESSDFSLRFSVSSAEISEFSTLERYVLNAGSTRSLRIPTIPV